MPKDTITNIIYIVLISHVYNIVRILRNEKMIKSLIFQMLKAPLCALNATLKINYVSAIKNDRFKPKIESNRAANHNRRLLKNPKWPREYERFFNDQMS